MMRPVAGCLCRGHGPALLAGLALAAALAALAGPPLPAFALAALGLVLPAELPGMVRPRLGALRRSLERLDLPAAASGMNGRLLATNAPLRAACGAPRCDLARTLATGFEVDAATIYRLGVAARKTGFGFEPARARVDGSAAVLVSRLVEPDVIVWTILPRERMPRLVGNPDATPYEAAPFAHLRVAEDGTISANAAWHRRYGEPGAQAAELARQSRGTSGTRALLTRPDGATELCSVWAFPASERGRAFRDLFVLPLDGDENAAGAQAVLDVMPVALMQFDLEGRLLWCNAQAREMVGHELSPGASLAAIVEPLGRPVDVLLSETAARSDSRREMVRLRDGHGDTFLHISLTPVTLEDTPGILAVLSDASELRLLEDKFAQSQKMEAVGKLAGGVAHDFNNVLTAISGHTDLLLLGKDALHPDYSDLIQIRQNAHRAAALVRQLLAFSRKQTLKPQRLSVEDVVSDTQYLLDRLIGEKVMLDVEHGPELGAVRADQQQLEQALMNLVVNARDAMRDGGTVTITTRNATLDAQQEQQNVEVPPGAYVEISVSDTGPGIEPHVIERIFEPFFTTKARGEGTGLGLSTVYGIVKQSGGFIFAENRAEGGARFRILLPRAQGDGAEAEVPAPPPRADRRDLTGRGAVLLVEDEDPVRAFASRALRLRGYEVAEAASAEEAMEYLAEPENHVDVLVSDVVMPGMDGPSFAVEARRMRPGLRVVFVSGYAEDSFRRTLMDADFLFLPKPFSLTDLTAKVKEALGQPA